MELSSCPQWRNSGGRRLGILPAPDIDIEPEQHLKPGAEFGIARVAFIGGRRYLQLADGRGWVPECSRKDSTRIVVEPLDSSSSAEPYDGKDDTATSSPHQRTEMRIRYLRVTVLSTRSPNTASTQIGRICLRAGGEVINLNDFVAEAIEGHSPAREGPEKVLTPKGKWLDMYFRDNGQSTVMISAPGLFEVDDIAFQTANDQPTRDPITITIDVSRDGWEWVHVMRVDDGSAMYMPITRLAWTPWFQLRVHGETADSVNAEELAPCSQTQLPSELSWWCNFDQRLGVVKEPELTVEPVDYLRSGACFAAIRSFTTEGRHYLQLPENRGWVLTSSRDDASHQVVELIGAQQVPAEVMERLQDVGSKKRSSRIFNRECGAVSVKHLRIIVLATRSSNGFSTQISQIVLRCNGDLLNLDSVAVENPRGQCPSNEGPEKVLRPVGKWLDMNFSSNHQSELLLVFQQEVQVEDFAFCTCSDMENRDPVKFRIDGSRNGQDWFVLHQSADNFPTPIARRTWTPWVLLTDLGSAPMAWKSTVVFSAPRHRCLVADCVDVFSRTDGYLVKGKLLMHMLRKHPNAKETEDLRKALKKKKATEHSKCGEFARRNFINSKEPSQKATRAKTSSCAARLLHSAETSAPRTPDRQVQRGTKRSIDAVSKADIQTPSPQAARDIATHTTGPRLTRLSELLEIPIGSRIDIEAEVQSMGPCKQGRLLKGAPGECVPMRRFVLRDGKTVCWWVLCGKRAEAFPESVIGHRIKVFGAKVHLFQGKRHLGGCSACHQLLVHA